MLAFAHSCHSAAPSRRCSTRRPRRQSRALPVRYRNMPRPSRSDLSRAPAMYDKLQKSSIQCRADVQASTILISGARTASSRDGDFNGLFTANLPARLPFRGDYRDLHGTSVATCRPTRHRILHYRRDGIREASAVHRVSRRRRGGHHGKRQARGRRHQAQADDRSRRARPARPSVSAGAPRAAARRDEADLQLPVLHQERPTPAPASRWRMS